MCQKVMIDYPFGGKITKAFANDRIIQLQWTAMIISRVR